MSAFPKCKVECSGQILPLASAMSAGNTQGVQVEVISNGCRLQLHADVANGLSVICQIHRGDRSAIATVRVSGGLDDLSESVPFRRA